MRGQATGGKPEERPARFADALRQRPFLVLYAAELQSIIGNQLARVALSVLVFERTGSATATALTYAATFLPAIFGGVFLASLGDRLPRRAVMIACDLVRAGLFAGMAIPDLPIAGLVGLLVVAVLLGPVFTSSQLSYLAGVLDGEVFRAATGLRVLSSQIAQVAGFAIGGVVVQALGPRGALLVNAATFTVSALVIAATLAGRSFAEHRRAASTVSPPEPPPAVTARQLLRERRIWVPLALGALAGLYVVPEGLAVPFAATAGATAAQTGLLMASIPLGSALGVALLVRRVGPSGRTRVAHRMAIACGIPLAATAVVPHWPAAVAFWFIAGALAAYQVEVITTVVRSTPDHLRARIVGIANSVLLGAQGLGLVVFGALAHVLDASGAIGLAGGLGSALALLIVGLNARLSRPDGSGAAAVGGGPSADTESPDHAVAQGQPAGGS